MEIETDAWDTTGTDAQDAIDRQLAPALPPAERTTSTATIMSGNEDIPGHLEDSQHAPPASAEAATATPQC